MPLASLFSRLRRPTTPDGVAASGLPTDPAVWSPQAEALALSRAATATSAQLLATDAAPLEIVQHYCDALVAASSHLVLAWCWFGERDAPTIRPLVSAGRAAAWAQRMAIPRNWLTRQGPARRCLSSGQSETALISRYAVWGPWRRLASEFPVASVRCIALGAPDDDRGGILVVYADQRDYFDQVGGFFDEIGALFGSVLSSREAARAADLRYTRRLELASETSGLGVWELDLARRTLEADPRVLAMFDLPVLPPRDLTSAVWAAIHPDDLSAVKAAFDRTIAGPDPLHAEFRVLTPGGQQRHVLCRATLLRDALGRPRSLVGVYLDVTDRREDEERLRRARDAAEAASRAKSDFLATMSHEIRTPLNGILGMSELAWQMARDPAQRECLQTVRDSGQVLLTVINDILDFSKVEAGRMDIEAVAVDLEPLVREALRAVQPAADKKGLSLVSRVDPALPPRVVGDPVRLRQILLNLLGNAVKFTPGGAVRVTLAVVPGAQPPRWRLSVKDTGIGIAPEVQQHIFDPFSQADTSTTRRFGGTGLGLSICKRLAELMGGRIAVSSVLGEGATFTVELPLQAAAAAPATAPEAFRATQPPPGLDILVVDDHPVNQKVAQLLLEKAGHRVAIARDGEEALERTRDQAFDVVLMDMQMPVMDGLEATRRIRAQELERQKHRARIIAMTASAMDSDRDACLAAGMDAFVAKPINGRELGRALSAFADPRPARVS